MSSNAARAAILVRALRAGIEADRRVVEEVCTDDVRAWTPVLATDSRDELVEVLARRDDAFSDVEIDAVPLDVAGEFACVEWCVSMTHSGPLGLDNGAQIEPTGERVTLNGVTVAEFRGEQICSLRQYWDAFAIIEQLGGGVVSS